MLKQSFVAYRSLLTIIIITSWNVPVVWSSDNNLCASYNNPEKNSVLGEDTTTLARDR